MTSKRATVGLAAALVVALLLWLVFLERGESPDARNGGPPPVPDAVDGSQALVPPAERRREHESSVVVGRILDLDGRPFADLLVAASASDGPRRTTHTDAEGRFELDGLPRSELELALSADFDPAQPLGERRLAAGVPALVLDLRQGPARADAGTHVLPRSRPYWIEGRVELDESWARAQGVGLGDVRIELETPGRDELVDAPELEPPNPPGTPLDWSQPPWRATLPETPLRVEEDGTFRIGLETPHDPFLLRIRLRRFEPIERLLWPVADGNHVETFRLP